MRHAASLALAALAVASLVAHAAGRPVTSSEGGASNFPAPWDQPYKTTKPLIGILAQVGGRGGGCGHAGGRRGSRPAPALVAPRACPRTHGAVGWGAALLRTLTHASPPPPPLLQACHYCPGRSYVAAGFVKWIEAAGARAVPIRCVLAGRVGVRVG